MGTISNPKHFFETGMKNLSDGAINEATLNLKQVEDIEEKRRKYIEQSPNMNDLEVKESIQKNIGMIGVEVYHAYLEELKSIYKPVNASTRLFNGDSTTELNRIRYFDITKWVTDSEEKNLDKLVNVYQVLSEDDCNIALIYHRTKQKCEVTLGVVNTDITQSDPAKVNTYNDRLVNAICGNFPGVEIRKNGGSRDDFGVGIPKNLNTIINDKNNELDIKSVAIVSNIASEKSQDFISQSMEKLLDGIVPKNEEDEYTIVLLAKPVNNQLDQMNRLFELYTALSPYSSWQTNYTYTTSDIANASSNKGVNLGGNIGAQIGIVDSLGVNASAHFGTSFASTTSVNVQVGANEGISQTYTNYGVQHALRKIESQLERIEESSALGMWEFASYVISKNPVVANNVAHMYLALTQGEESYMSRATVTLWDCERDKDDAKAILENVQRLQHPVFALQEGKNDRLLFPTLITPSTLLSGKELAKALNFPRKSVSGLPVLESTTFGREVHKVVPELYTDRKIKVGNIYHMRNEESTEVSLDIDSFASHVFVSGSTGTGKSNAIYQLLDNLDKNNVKFLIIEPAKGEYKKVFGGRCKVFGTNINKTELLKVNPFSFPDDIHVLEHIDRLIEIFNACWSMYAAMPAILKDAVEKSYEKVGWNLLHSKCEPLKFPTFNDLIESLLTVLDSSAYSLDTMNDYKGALVTRISSLTNGIFGQIFCSGNELSNEELFENNVIIDLSRVGSSETKSLMMGIMVMKLQEYRLSIDAMNEELKHVTVLEEAHNLLRKTSMTQSQESSNLQGKAVEMLTNSIAEMRTYGEGFIIADQAPELLDDAVIRNTNTKIILRLPSESDRQLVGSSMALNDKQITELSKLPRGVAIIYQNDWIEAVLCKFKKYENICPLKYVKIERENFIENFLLKAFDIDYSREIKSENVDEIKNWIDNLNKKDETKNILYKVLNSNYLTQDEKSNLAYNVFNGKEIHRILKNETNEMEGIKKANIKISNQYLINNTELIDVIRQFVFQTLEKESALPKAYVEYCEGGKIR